MQCNSCLIVRVRKIESSVLEFLILWTFTFRLFLSVCLHDSLSNGRLLWSDILAIKISYNWLIKRALLDVKGLLFWNPWMLKPTGDIRVQRAVSHTNWIHYDVYIKYYILHHSYNHFLTIIFDYCNFLQLLYNSIIYINSLRSTSIMTTKKNMAYPWDSEQNKLWFDVTTILVRNWHWQGLLITMTGINERNISRWSEEHPRMNKQGWPELSGSCYMYAL